jgi:hypothetical protein
MHPSHEERFMRLRIVGQLPHLRLPGQRMSHMEGRVVKRLLGLGLLTKQGMVKLVGLAFSALVLSQFF